MIKIFIDNLIGIGLIIDIIGIIIIFICTSSRKIEADIVYRAMRHLTDEMTGGEWLYKESFETHQKRLDNTRKKVGKNTFYLRSGLIILILGIFFQLIGTYLDSANFFV